MKHAECTGAFCSLVAGHGRRWRRAAAADKETRQMMADIRMLQEQSQQLQNLIAR